MGFLLSFINRRHGFSRQSVFTEAIDIEPPVSVADAEEKRTAAIETEVGGIVIQVHGLVARIAPFFAKVTTAPGTLPRSPPPPAM